MGRETFFSLAVLISTLISPARAFAEDWIYESHSSEERRTARLRFETHVGLWVASYDRRQSACRGPGSFGPPSVPPERFGAELRPAQERPPGTPSFSCNPENSREIGLGAGGELAFHVAGPFSLTFGADVLFTQPSDYVKNQLIVALPFGFLLSPLDWNFRPMFKPKITPLLYLTDGARDYALGADFGFAWRVFEWADISLLLGYEAGRSNQSYGLRFGLHPF